MSDFVISDFIPIFVETTVADYVYLFQSFRGLRFQVYLRRPEFRRVPYRLPQLTVRE